MNNTTLLLGVFATSLLGSGTASACAGLSASRTNSMADPQPKQSTKTMKIRIKINGESGTATLLENSTAIEFVKLLPLTLKLSDYAATEKISDLPVKLSTSGAPAGIDPAIGDITYYAPWGNLALFHRDFGFSKGLVKIGRLDSAMPILAKPGVLIATFEVADQ